MGGTCEPVAVRSAFKFKVSDRSISQLSAAAGFHEVQAVGHSL